MVAPLSQGGDCSPPCPPPRPLFPLMAARVFVGSEWRGGMSFWCPFASGMGYLRLAASDGPSATHSPGPRCSFLLSGSTSFRFFLLLHTMTSSLRCVFSLLSVFSLFTLFPVSLEGYNIPPSCSLSSLFVTSFLFTFPSFLTFFIPIPTFPDSFLVYPFPFLVHCACQYME